MPRAPALADTPAAVRARLTRVHFAAPPVAVDAFALSVPLQAPVVTSFGTMHDRPALLVRLRDADGREGWGEAWCNFPPGGAAQRATIVARMVAPLLAEIAPPGPAALFAALTRRFHVIGLQTAEPGLFDQVAAGVDIAAWDLAARQHGVALWRLLGATGAAGAVPCYASGINPGDVDACIGAARAAGYRAFKVKLGFGIDRDLQTLHAARAAAGPLTLMADVNQGWSVAQARAALPRLGDAGLAFLEEPVPADTPLARWRALAAVAPMPLAAGENLRDARLVAAARSGAFGLLQPDIAKWGGFSGLLPRIRQIAACGVAYWPHYLGAAVGLVASAHLLRAAGGRGMLEVDANPNPLRSALGAPLTLDADGALPVPDVPGLGFAPDPAALAACAA